MASLAAIGTARLLAPGDDVLTEAAFTAVKVRNTPSWPRNWANFSLL